MHVHIYAIHFVFPIKTKEEKKNYIEIINEVNLKEASSSFTSGKKERKSIEKNGRKKIKVACSISNRYSHFDWLLSV